MEAIANKLDEASQCDKKMNLQRPFPEYWSVPAPWAMQSSQVAGRHSALLAWKKSKSAVRKSVLAGVSLMGDNMQNYMYGLMSEGRREPVF